MAKNHKWTDEGNKFNKQDRCIKCGVFRTWIGGDMQCWNYWYPFGHKNHTLNKIFKRPECVG